MNKRLQFDGVEFLVFKRTIGPWWLSNCVRPSWFILKREGLVNTSNSRWAQEPDKQISKSVTCIGESVNSHLSEETNFTKTTELVSWTHGH